MAKGFGGMPGGMNMNNLVKQAQKVQRQMEEMQEGLANKIIETTSGGGAVKIEISGKKEVKKVTISPDVIDPDDIEMLEDLILSAVNEAVRQADELMTNEMNKVTGGFSMPGMF